MQDGKCDIEVVFKQHWNTLFVHILAELHIYITLENNQTKLDDYILGWVFR